MTFSYKKIIITLILVLPFWCVLSKAVNPHDLTQIAKKLYEEAEVAQDYAKAFQLFNEAAELGDSEAQKYLGICYFSGNGTHQDFDLAISHLTKASEAGDPDAQCFLATLYSNLFDPPLYEEALKWYQIAAEGNYPEAQTNLGIFYLKGSGTEQNMDKALYWIEKAAQVDYPYAVYLIGLFYYSGIGYEKDIASAISWFEKAVNLGFPDAKYRLGFLYYFGEGVEQSETKGLRLILEAAQDGVVDAQELIHELAGKLRELGY